MRDVCTGEIVVSEAIRRRVCERALRVSWVITEGPASAPVPVNESYRVVLYDDDECGEETMRRDEDDPS